MARGGGPENTASWGIQFVIGDLSGIEKTTKAVGTISTAAVKATEDLSKVGTKSGAGTKQISDIFKGINEQVKELNKSLNPVNTRLQTSITRFTSLRPQVVGFTAEIRGLNTSLGVTVERLTALGTIVPTVKGLRSAITPQAAKAAPVVAAPVVAAVAATAPKTGILGQSIFARGSIKGAAGDINALSLVGTQLGVTQKEIASTAAVASAELNKLTATANQLGVAQGALKSQSSAVAGTLAATAPAAKAISPAVAQATVAMTGLGKGFLIANSGKVTLEKNIPVLIKATGQMVMANKAAAASLVQTKQGFVQGGIAAVQAGDQFDKTNKILGSVGSVFAALFVTARIRDWANSLIGFIVGLAKEGAEYEAQLKSLNVTAAKFGVGQTETGEALQDLSSRFLTLRTAAEATRVLMASGLSLKQSSTLIKAFEESALRADLGLRGLNDRVLQAANNFRDRMSRPLGQNVTLQTNFGQALRLVNKNLDDLNVAAGRVGRTMTLQGESVKWFTALMGEYRLVAGLAAVMTTTVVGQLALLDKNIKNMRLAFGTALAPVLGLFVRILNTIVPAISEWASKNKDLIRSIGLISVVVAGILSGVLTLQIAIISLVAAIQFAGPAVAALIIGIGGLIPALAALAMAILGPKRYLIEMAGALGTLWGALKASGDVLNALTRIVLSDTADMIRAFDAGGKGAGAFADMLDIPLKAIEKLTIAWAKFKTMGDRLDTFIPVDYEDLKIGLEYIEKIDEKVKKFGRKGILLDMSTNLKELGLAEGEIKKINDLAARVGIVGIPAIGDVVKRIKVTLAVHDLEVGFKKMRNSSREARAEFEAAMKKLLEGLDDTSIGLSKTPPEWQEFGSSSSAAAKSGTESLKDMLSELLTLRDALLDLNTRLKDIASNTFFSQDSAFKRASDFSKAWDDAFRNTGQSISKFVIKTDEEARRLDQNIVDMRAKLRQAGSISTAIEPAESTESTGVSKEETDKTRKGMETNLSDLLKAQREYAKRGVASLLADQITEELGSIYNKVQLFWKQRMLREELVSMDDMIIKSQNTIDAIGEARSFATAREYNDRLVSVDMMLEYEIISAKRGAQIRKDIEKNVAFDIMKNMSSVFRFIVEQSQAFADILKDEIGKLVDFTNKKQDEIDRINKSREKARDITDARLREQELINDVNATERNEKDRQARITLIRAETARNIRLIEEGEAEKSVSTLTSIYQRLADSIVKSLIDRVVNYGINQVMMPAITSLFDRMTGSRTSDALKKATDEFKLGQSMVKALEELNKLPDALKIAQEEQVSLLGQILKELQIVNGALPSGPTSGLFDPGELRSRTGDERDLLPKDKSPVASALENKKAEDSIRNIAIGMNELTVIVGTVGSLLAIFGEGVTKTFGTLMALISVVRMLVSVIEALQTASAISTFVKTATIGLASGGIATGPTLATIAEMGTPEVILPLDQRHLDMMTRSLNRGGSQYASPGVSSYSRGSTMTITVNVPVNAIDPKFAKQIVDEVHAGVEDRVRRVVKRSTIGSGSTT